MIFRYFTDEIILDSNNSDTGKSLRGFDDFAIQITKALRTMNIDSDTACIFYKRNKRGESVLGIQLVGGDSECLSNYVVYDSVTSLGEGIHSNVDIHFEPPATSRFNDFFLLVPCDDIQAFFEGVEFDVITSNEPDKEYDVMKKVQLKKNRLLQIFKGKKTRNN